MPGWKTHLHASEKLLEVYHIEHKKDFKIGGILPDVPWLNYDSYDQVGTLKFDLHYYMPHEGNKAFVPDYRRFFTDHNDLIMGADIYKGMLFHLILDSVFNERWNRSSIESPKGEFNIELANGTIKHIKGVREKIDFCRSDLQAYEDTIQVECLSDSEVTPYVNTVLKEFGCNWPLINLTEYINDIIDNKYGTKNVIFTIGQYDRMITTAIQKFVYLLK